MRKDYAVSEVIGAVILIGLVMGGIAIIGVILLSTPPPEKTPKASISSYCVRCDLQGTYEIIMYHGGGETLDRNITNFFLHTDDGKQEQITPWWVYDSTPEDCMFSDIGDSSLSGRETWTTSDYWKSGQTLRFRFISDKQPAGIDVRYIPYKSPMMSANFKNEIRDSTCVKDKNPDECTDPTAELTPKLKSVSCPAGCNGDCQAIFTYNLTSGSYSIPVHQSGKPWNYFQGSETAGTLEDFSSSTSEIDTVKVNFSKSVVWWLGRSKSEKATCG
ncbi:type IV pilin N-terminal domain-containing protein [Methanospirillum lacunae]|uniref:Archaeal Type IV pilin N-terminal domain-containing protein n=1 Tax=Methanospirillum lacunae TaxID=668570 RepID=A0A2V2MYR9_9EURY|nr:type IV pilin N-terminal domain-containing protein [Methanospirillum lacunae]PWR70566.1 hypothetical protein DK846_14325 [Methanospirillum lacunae]